MDFGLEILLEQVVIVGGTAEEGRHRHLHVCGLVTDVCVGEGNAWILALKYC